MPSMLYRDCPDLTPPAEADLDTDEMVATATCVERGERHLRVLERLTEIGMRLAEALGRKIEARIEAAAADDDVLDPGKDPTVAFSRIAQTIRRTVALEAKLAEGVKTRRESLLADRSTRRADRKTAHEAAKTQAVIYGFHDAYAVSCAEAEYAEQVENLMEDAQEYLGDADEFRGWLDRPVGETVARLCAALGLDPDSCTPDGETWRVRRPPTEFEMRAVENLPPSPLWGGTDGEAVRVGLSPDGPQSFDHPTEPHSGCFASCPSP